MVEHEPDPRETAAGSTGEPARGGFFFPGVRAVRPAGQRTGIYGVRWSRRRSCMAIDCSWRAGGGRAAGISQVPRPAWSRPADLRGQCTPGLDRSPGTDGDEPRACGLIALEAEPPATRRREPYRVFRSAPRGPFSGGRKPVSRSGLGHGHMGAGPRKAKSLRAPPRGLEYTRTLGVTALTTTRGFFGGFIPPDSITRRPGRSARVCRGKTVVVLSRRTFGPSWNTRYFVIPARPGFGRMRAGVTRVSCPMTERIYPDPAASRCQGGRRQAESDRGPKTSRSSATARPTPRAWVVLHQERALRADHGTGAVGPRRADAGAARLERAPLGATRGGRSTIPCTR